jgi:transposase
MTKKQSKKKVTKPLTREEELLEENKYLRAEVDYLKKLEALIQAQKNKG